MGKIGSSFGSVESKSNDDLEIKDWNFLPDPVYFKLPLLTAW